MDNSPVVIDLSADPPRPGPTGAQWLAATVVLDRLCPGRTTFTAEYRAEDGSPVPVFFSDRNLVVAPLAVDG